MPRRDRDISLSEIIQRFTFGWRADGMNTPVYICPTSHPSWSFYSSSLIWLAVSVARSATFYNALLVLCKLNRQKQLKRKLFFVTSWNLVNLASRSTCKDLSSGQIGPIVDQRHNSRDDISFSNAFYQRRFLPRRQYVVASHSATKWWELSWQQL